MLFDTKRTRGRKKFMLELSQQLKDYAIKRAIHKAGGDPKKVPWLARGRASTQFQTPQQSKCQKAALAASSVDRIKVYDNEIKARECQDKECQDKEPIICLLCSLFLTLFFAQVIANRVIRGSAWRTKMLRMGK